MMLIEYRTSMSESVFACEFDNERNHMIICGILVPMPKQSCNRQKAE